MRWEEKEGQKRGERRRGRDDVKKSEMILDLAKSSDRHWGSTSGPLSSTDPRATVQAVLKDGTTATVVMTPRQSGRRERMMLKSARGEVEDDRGGCDGDKSSIVSRYTLTLSIRNRIDA